MFSTRHVVNPLTQRCKLGYYYSMAAIKVINIDPALRKAFKILCTEQDISMSQKLIQLIRKEVEKNAGKRK